MASESGFGKLRPMSSLEQRISLPESHFDPSKAFKKNKDAQKESEKRSHQEDATKREVQQTVSTKKDFIDNENSKMQHFSEEVCRSKHSESSWFNEDKVKELQIKITPYKRGEPDRKGPESPQKKHASPAQSKVRKPNPESPNILDIIKQENQKVTQNGTESRGEQPEKPATKVADSEPQKWPRRVSATEDKAGAKSGKRQSVLPRFEKSPIRKNPNKNNLLKRITEKLRKEPKIELRESGSSKHKFRQRSPIVTKMVFKKMQTSTRQPAPESKPTRLYNGFSSSESSSDSESSRSSSNSSSSSGSSSESS